ncbi:MAG: hypothetical protein AUJ18_09990 [Candidatus Hydrogenedentes bacterium CG1_02_42_14]|nr:MAG: hypothetical protein AUJ18_09990 [Candidatus Hydrogenedentes bacterium CG1_02_42_14]
MDRIEKELNLLRRISSILLAEPPRISLEVPEQSSVLDKLVFEIASAMEAEAATIFLRDDAPKRESEPLSFLIRATYGLNSSCVGKTRIKPHEGLAGTAIAERRIVSVPDGQSDSRYEYKQETGEERYHGFLAAPIMRGNEVLGILVLHFAENRSASGDEIRIIAALAEQLGFALENARLYTELQERMSARIQLYEMMRALSDTMNLKNVFKEIVLRVRKIIPSKAAIIRIFNVETNKLHVETISTEEENSIYSLEPQDLGQGVAGQAARHVKPVLVNEIENDPRVADYRGLHNILAVPLIYNNRVVGTIELIGREASESGRTIPFTEQDIKLLTVLAQIAAESYSKAELYSEMESIALTFKRKNQELMILNKISREIHGSTSADEILATILTGVTAGYGLGYNRAMILLLDGEMRSLNGAMGIGPGVEEVARVWSEAPERLRTLDEYLISADVATILKSPFNQIARKIKIPITGEPSLISRVLAERKSFNIKNTSLLLGSDKLFAQEWKSSAFALVPLCSKDLVIGILAADNIFNQRPIQDEELILLQTIANQCGLALEGARMVDELNLAMKRLEVVTGKLIESEKLATIGEMAAGIAHDIRNPLTAIGGFTKRMARRLPVDDEGRRYAGIIESEVERLEKLCADILQLASKRDMSKTVVNAVEIAKNWKIRNETRLRRKKVSFKIEIDNLQISCDQILFDQAVSNILENAFDAVDTGGDIRFGGYSDEKRVYLKISDNGCGMTTDQIEKIFEAFYTTKTEGTGLGLAIARKAISAHNGEIGIESKPGQGTVFTIALPK